MAELWQSLSGVLVFFHHFSEDNVIVVAPETPGQPDNSFQEKLDKAFRKLIQPDVKTLIFVFSGHHLSDGFVLGHNNQKLMDKKLQQYFMNLPKHVERLVLFLDCCHADLEKLGETGRNSVYFSVCQENQTVPIDENHKCSLFTTFLLQALTMKARGGKCYNSEKGTCSLASDGKCSLPGDFFVTPENLMAYLNVHIRDLKKPVLPDFQQKGVDWILGYKYDFDVLVTVEIIANKFLKSELRLSPDMFPTLPRLRELLMEKYLGKAFIYIKLTMGFQFYG